MPELNAEISAAQREKKLLELTLKELSSYPADTPVYTGVGKMYVRPHVPEELTSRFLKEDIGVVKKSLDSQITQQNDTIQNLREKQIMVERMVKDAQSQMNEIIGRR